MRVLIISIFLILFLPFSSIVLAKDYLVQDNGEVEIIISRENLNRLKIFQDRIKDIRTNSDELIIEIDKTSGEIFLKPASSKTSIDIFLKTENGFTYKLILKVKDIQAQQIFLNRNNLILRNYADSDILRREKLKLIDENLYFDFNNNYKLSAINLIRAMSSNVNLKDFVIIIRNYQELLSYKDFKVEWLSSYIKNDKSGISGEIAIITNISKNVLDLKEEIFFRKGIKAVRLQKTKLEPKEFCLLYFVGGEK